MPRRYRAIPMARPLLWDSLTGVHHRWPYLGHLTVAPGPCMGQVLAIETGPMPVSPIFGRPAKDTRGSLGSWSPGNRRRSLPSLAAGIRRNPRELGRRCLPISQSDCHRTHRRRRGQASNTSLALSRARPGHVGARHVHYGAMWPPKPPGYGGRQCPGPTDRSWPPLIIGGS